MHIAPTSHEANSISLGRSLRTLLAVLAMLVLAGCEPEKESLHEHDHEEPEHWPASMQDAARLIEQRLAILSNTSSDDTHEKEHAQEELLDLVEWSPEIAADTDLAEEAWLPIFAASESLRKGLQSSNSDPQDFVDEFKQLVQLLNSAYASLDGSLSRPGPPVQQEAAKTPE